MTIDALRSFFEELGMPTTLRQAGIELDEAHLSELLDKATFNGRRTLGNFRVLERADMEAIYRRCM